MESARSVSAVICAEGGVKGAEHMLVTVEHKVSKRNDKGGDGGS
jgi:hypothetical protein